MVRKSAKLKSASSDRASLSWRLGFIAVLVLISLWKLVPTFQYYSMSNEQRAAMDPGKLEKIKDKSLNLGLDLQGGIHLVMQVKTEGMDKAAATDAVDRAMTVIANRVDQFGLTEPIVQKQGENRIIIELPGMSDVERAKNLIGKTARLEFKLLKTDEEIKFVTDKLDLYLSSGVLPIAPVDTTKAPADTTKVPATALKAVTDTTKVAADTSKANAFGDEKKDEQTAKKFSGMLSYQQSGGVPSFDMLVSKDDVPRMDVILKDPGVQKILEETKSVLLWGPEENGREDNMRELFLAYAASEMTGEMVKDARVTMGNGVDAGKPEISMENTPDGVGEWARISGANIGKRLAIVLDNIVYSSPKFLNKIYGGKSSITGNFTNDEAKDLALVLRSGALPASVEIMEDRTVGPTLGADSIRSSVMAFIIGLSAIVFFMIAYYFGQGLIAVFALILNAIFILAYLALFKATLTLPGMAGIILTMGMAVDANVLVFERIREELRLGNSTRVAIANGYLRARWAILDSNITTFLTGIILFNFGTGPIKGFALTLMVGIISTIFTALFASRALTDLLTLKLNHISVGKMTVFQGAKFPFIGFRKKAYILSGALILVAIISLIAHKGPKYSIDFVGGSLIELHFDKPVQIGEIRDSLGKVDVPGTDFSTSEIQFLGQDNKDVLIRIVKVGNMQETSTKVKEALRADFSDRVPANVNDWLLREEMVGPTIGKELQGKAWMAIFWSLVVLLVYITIRFEFKYSLGAILSLLHDTIITIGMFSLLNKEISLTIIAAILTLIGYSLNDTIVVFDRIREKLRKGISEGYTETLDRAINETLSRTTITSFLTLLSVLALFFFGGEVINGFSFALIVGVVVGTYSSIFVATPVVVEWYMKFEKNKKQKKL
jgi:SecD/SecF fusion protein